MMKKKKKTNQKKEQKENLNKEKIQDLSKYNSLIKIININLEVKGFSKSDIKTELDELYKTLSDSITQDDLQSKISENLLKLLEISIESDKLELTNFIRDLVKFYEGDKNKVYEQIIAYIENIEEQEKLTTRKANRAIRGFIQDCKEK